MNRRGLFRGLLGLFAGAVAAPIVARTAAVPSAPPRTMRVVFPPMPEVRFDATGPWLVASGPGVISSFRMVPSAEPHPSGPSAVWDFDPLNV